MIQKTYFNDDQEDRLYSDDLWSWLKNQPQDVWLLWIRCANWDQADGIMHRMLNDPRCDLAIVSWVFWLSRPHYWIENPDKFTTDSLLGQIIANLEKGFYGSSELYCSRSETVHEAHAYRKALLDRPDAPRPFLLPRLLCGPFAGRPAAVPQQYDADTERDLKEIFDNIDGSLPRSEQEYRKDRELGWQVWLEDLMPFPAIDHDPIESFAHLDDPGFIEAIYGSQESYQLALEKARAINRQRSEEQSRQLRKRRSKWWPFG
ncbi:MAG: DUF4274 domain-containing protein [Hyphomicrobiaceae bacterium]